MRKLDKIWWNNLIVFISSFSMRRRMSGRMFTGMSILLHQNGVRVVWVGCAIRSSSYS